MKGLGKRISAKERKRDRIKDGPQDMIGYYWYEDCFLKGPIQGEGTPGA